MINNISYHQKTSEYVTIPQCRENRHNIKANKNGSFVIQQTQEVLHLIKFNHIHIKHINLDVEKTGHNGRNV